MKFRIWMVVLVLLISCNKETDETPILVIGHGGMGLEFSGSIYHDNSKEAFDLALDIHGVDGIEMDVRLSADGDLWAFHDDDLKKETNKEGCIENMTFDQLNGTKYKGTGSEVLKRLVDMDLNSNGKRIFLDIKHYNACNGTIHDVNDFVSALLDLPAYYQNASLVRIVTSNKDWIPVLISAGFSVVYSSDIAGSIDAVFQDYPETIGMAIKNQSVTKNQVAKYMEQGKAVYIYEVRSPKKLKEAGNKLPTGVMSDDVQGAVLEYK